MEELGWDYFDGGMNISIGGQVSSLEGIAEKRGMVVCQYKAKSEGDFPNHSMRQRIEREVAKRVREHLIVYVSHDEEMLVWRWVQRELGRSERTRTHDYHRGQAGELLVQKLERLSFALEEEEGLSIADVTGRVGLAFDVEKVTKQFYERFKREHSDFLGFIEGGFGCGGAGVVCVGDAQSLDVYLLYPKEEVSGRRWELSSHELGQKQGVEGGSIL